MFVLILNPHVELRGLDKGCARDLPQPKKLGINAIRAYSIDSRLNHVLCMATLSGAGIYVMCVVSLFH
jgi:hypothetical protein